MQTGALSLEKLKRRWKTTNRVDSSIASPVSMETSVKSGKKLSRLHGYNRFLKAALARVVG